MDFLAQLAEGLFPPDAKARMMALLWGYFDESGTDGQHGFTVITGFVAPLDEWSLLLANWDAQLKTDGIETFHYVECKHRQKQYYGWDWETQCKPHLERLSSIIEGHGVAAVNAGFTGNYPALVKTLPPVFAARYPTAYGLCFELLVENIRQASQRWTEGPIALIFAHIDGFAEKALARWAEAKQHNRWPEILHIGYSFPDLAHQLQCADMLAWETRRFMWDKTPVDDIKDLPLLSKLIAKEQDIGNTLYESSLDEEAVRKMADEFAANARRNGRAD